MSITKASLIDLNGQELILDADADTSITADTDDQIDIKIAGSDVITLTSSAITSSAGATITVADNSDNLTLTTTDADASSGPNVKLYRNSSSPADNDFLGNIKFVGRNDNSQDVQYAEEEVYILDASDGTEDGLYNINVITGGTNLSYLQLKAGTGSVFNEDGNDIDFRVEGDSEANLLFVDAANDKIGVLTNAPSGQFHVYNGMLQVGSKTGDTSIQQNTNAIRIAAVPNSSTEWGGLQWYREFSDVIGAEIIAARASSTETDTDLIFKTSTDSSNAVEAMRIDHSGKLLLGKTTTAFGTAGSRFDGSNIQITADGATSGYFNRLSSNGSVLELYQAGTLKAEIGVDAGGMTVNESSANLDFRVETDGNSNALVVESGQNCVIVGSQTAENRLSQPFAVTSAGTRGGMVINSFHNSDSGPILDFQVSRNTTAGSHTVVQDGDALGTLIFRGDDGDEFRDSAAIEARVDGTPGNNDMPGELAFLTTASSSLAEHMVIKSDGKIGVGTNTPATNLQVMTNSSTQIRCSGESNNNRAVAIEYDASDGPLVRAFSSGITTLKFFVDNTSLAGKFDSNGDFYSNDGTVHSLSDVRIKTDINDLEDGLDIVKQLKPKTFKYTEDAEFFTELNRDKVSYGFVANEVEKVAPQYTDTGKGKIGDVEVDDLKSLSTTKMIPMLVKAIQEQQAQIETLEAKVNALQGGE